MNKHQKLILKILLGASDANISFNDLCALLRFFGFEETVRGSHHLFRKVGIEERPNLQADGSKAKPYQVRQVRAIILRYKWGVEK